MKKCYRCGTRWTGYGKEPRAREVCAGCGAYMHCCSNCHHFDHKLTTSCVLKHTQYVGPRTQLNYCEEFSMTNWRQKEAEARVDHARTRWEALFEK